MQVIFGGMIIVVQGGDEETGRQTLRRMWWWLAERNQLTGDLTVTDPTVEKSSKSGV